MNWSAKADALVRVVHPTLVADRLGVSIEAVMARRAELGMAPVEEQFARGPFNGGGKPQISEEEIAVIRAHSVGDAAEILGKSRGWVGRHRQHLDIAPLRKAKRR